MSTATELSKNALPDPDITVRNEDEYLNPEFIAAIEQALQTNDRFKLKQLAANLHEADTGDLLETLGAEQRAKFVRLLEDDFDYTALTEIDEAVRLELLDVLPNAAIAEGLEEIDSDDAVFILEDLDEDDQAAILEELPYADRAQLQKALDYPEDSAGRRMQSEFIAVAPFWTIGQTIDYMREASDLPDDFYEIYVVDPTFKLLGSVHLDKILRTQRIEKITSIMEESRQAVIATEDQEEVARRFERYNLVSSAVVDENDRLVGVLTVDDIVDVIQEEAEEDIRALAGVGDEEISDSVVTIARSRFTWLVVNLGTAILASVVIAFFEDTIEAMVALAVLMPIVASMGGNAGTQTMTVAVRGIATQELSARNMMRILNREILVSVLNGVGLAALIGITAWLWFASPGLGIVIAAAIVINMLFAGLSGLLIPFALDRLNIDPAIASSVFVTTVTDVVGFFAFLCIAALWFGLPL